MIPAPQGAALPPAGAARVLRAEGNVSVIRDTQAWAVTAGQFLQPRQEIVTGDDGYALFELPDGSQWEVFANSRAVFRQNPGNLRELIDLWVGRIKVHIQKLNGEPNPNRVRTPTAVISVRGTTFDIEVSPDGEETYVGVEEGVVAVQHAILPYTEPKVLKAGDSVRVYKNAPLAKRFDRGLIAQKAIRAINDLLIFRGPRLGGGGGTGPAAGGSTGGGVGLPGDTGGAAPPPPPPPPPPPGN